MNVAADNYECVTGEAQDLASAAQAWGFFEQGDAIMDTSIERGIFTTKEASDFRRMPPNREGVHAPLTPASARWSPARPDR